MNERRVSALLVAVTLVLATALVACRKSGPDWRILQLYSGETSVDLIRHPDKVQALRLAPPGAAPNPGEAHAGPFVAAGDPAAVLGADAAALSAIVTDPDTFEWQRGPKRDPFRPQVALLFVRGAYVLEIAVDLGSAQLAVYAGEQTLGMQSFDAARPQILAIAKRLFPGDAAIQSLR